jgi:hypothetical protein
VALQGHRLNGKADQPEPGLLDHRVGKGADEIAVLDAANPAVFRADRYQECFGRINGKA